MIAHGTSSEQTQLTSLRYCCGIFSYKVLKQWKTITLENVNNRQYLKSLEESGEYQGFSVKNLENASNVRQWDEACLPLYKFDTLDEMFKKCDSTNYLNDIPIPICFINAADDPVCLWSRLENHEVFKNSNMGFICTSNGGHLGWVDSENGGWISRLILKLITGFITEYYIENDRRY
jgi:predicted alpha/beta-fold hydrolase